MVVLYIIFFSYINQSAAARILWQQRRRYREGIMRSGENIYRKDNRRRRTDRLEGWKRKGSDRDSKVSMKIM